MPLGKLDAPTQSRLRSTQILTSLPQIVSELLQNSLDAGSSIVEIGLDAQEWMCWVKDNGHGISKQDLEIIGEENDSGRYSTSKVYAQNLMNGESTFGFRGEALASASELSCIELSSRTVHARESWSIIVKGGKRLYIGPSVRWRREIAGTVVCIRDAFYNLPVRRLSHPSPAKTWELVRQEVEKYALVFPNVTFTMEDAHESKSGTSNEDRVIRIAKTSSSVESFRRLFGRALVEDFEEIDSSEGELRIQGFISLVASHSKNHQHTYINRHPMDVGDLHRMVNYWFSRSSFARTALNENGELDLPGAGTRRSPRKAEKRPIYVINLCIPPSSVDNILEPSKSSIHLKDQSSVTRFLSTTVHNFLQKHGFSPEPSCRPQSSLPAISESPRKRRRTDLFDDSGFAEADEYGTPASSIRRQPTHEEDSPPSALFVSVDGESEHVAWTVPATGESFIIDSRIGDSLGRKIHGTITGTPPSSQVPLSSESDRRTIGLNGSQSAAEGTLDVPEWLTRALKGNAAYRPTEQRLCAHFDPRPITSGNQAIDGRIDLSLNGRKLTRDNLVGARVVAQIDRKFVACVMEAESSSRSVNSERASHRRDAADLLVLVDQHAADERIRVESFLKPLCLGFILARSGKMDPGEATPITWLTPPRPALLTRHEASVLMRNSDVRELFRCWGISVAESAEKGGGGASPTGGNGDYVQVFVTSLPEIVTDKLLQNNELQDLLKATISEFESGKLSMNSTSVALGQALDGRNDWLPALRWCPRSLLELINSKACRGAIMFNDELTIEQCERMVTQLSQTAFPFQCAHGRPSLISLIDINTIPRTSQARRLCDWRGFEQ